MRCDKKDLLLYGVTDRSWLGDRTLAQQVEASLRGGATMIQLREKHMDRGSILAQALELRELCGRYGVPLILNDAIPEEHKDGIDMSRNLLRRSHVLVVCGHTMTEAMKNDIAVAQRLGITATTLEGILTVKGQGKR